MDLTPIGRREERSGSHRSRERYDYSREPRGGRDRSLTRRLKLPLFDGEQADSWVLKVEQFFELADYTEEEKLRTVRTCFDGEALLWYRWERDRNPFRSWNQMKFRILEQYSANRDTSAGERLLTLRQTGTVRDYCKEFKSLAMNAPELSEDVLELAFMIGLKAKIRTGVKMFDPRGLQKMMEMAKKVEDWSVEEDPGPTKGGKSSGSGPSSFSTKPNSGGSGPQLTRTKPNPSPPTPNVRGNEKATNHGRLKPPFRRLTPEEVAR